MNARRLTSTALVSLCVGACGLAFSIAAASGEMIHTYETQITGSSPAEPFGAPWGIAFNAGGQLLAADSVHSALDIFEPSNLFAPPQLVSSVLSGSEYSATRSVAVAAGTGDLYVGSSGGPNEFFGGGSESVDVFEPEGGNTYRLLDEGHERHFHAAYGNYPYVAVDNSTDPLDERKGDVYVLAYSPTNGSVAEVFVIKPNGAGELPEETAAEEQSKALPQPPGGFSSELGSEPGGAGGIAVDPATGEVYVSNPRNHVVNVFNDKGEEQPALNLDGSETPGRFSPVGIAIDSTNEMVYVVSQQERAVDQFSKGTGKFLGQITQTPSGEMLREPKGVAVQEAAGPTRGDVYVTSGQSVDVFGPSLVVADVRLTGASNVGKTTVTLSGTVNPDEVPVSGCRFEYMSSEESTFTHSEACSPSPGSGAVAVPVSAAIGGLAPGTSYSFRLSATNVNGTSNGLGREESFKTPPAVEALSTGAASAGAKPTDETLTGSLSPEGTDAHYYFQYGTSTAYGATSPAPPGTDAGTGGAGCEPPGGPSCSPVSAQTSLSGLESDTEYHYRLVGVDSFGVTYGEDATFTSGGPGIQEESVSDVAASSATLEAQIAPKSLPTTSYFEYGASVEYGSTIPAPPGTEVNAGEASVAVNRHLDGLLAGTVYHYRVVAVSETAPGVLETFDGHDHTFTTQPPGSGFVLPDGRQWEMVTPPDKLGGNVDPIGANGLNKASVNGDAMVYVMNLPPEAEPSGYAAVAQTLSRRSSESWAAQDIAVPHEQATGVAVGAGVEYRFFSEDLSLGIVHPFGPYDPSLAAEASEQTEFLRTDYSNGNVDDPCSTSCYRPLLTRKPGYANVPPGVPWAAKCSVICGPQARGATPDLSHIVIKSAVALTVGGAPGLYEWAAGKLIYIGSARNFGSSEEEAARYAISNDGSRVIFNGQSEGQTGLLLRDTVKGKTVRLAEGKGEFQSNFQIASSDDSRVFFTGARLTTTAGDLLECEMVEKEGSLTCNLSNLTPSGGQVQGVLGASEDGSYIYFVALGALAEGAVAGADNLYVRHGGVTKLVSILAERDRPDWELDKLTSRVSPDGRWLAFMSDQNLTGYITRDAISGIPDEEVYLYDAAGSGHLVCASCNPSGARPVGIRFEGTTGSAAALSGPEKEWFAANIPAATLFELGVSGYLSRALSDSGRLFFNSNDALAPQDVNGAIDVYEYEPPSVGNCSASSVTFSERSGGCIALVSSGTSAEESAFLDASGSGGDVFFMTEARLSFKDVDTSFDIYDAHECRAGSPCFPAQAAPPPPCDTGDACKPSPTPQPAIFGTPSSATFSGAGNIVPSAPPAAVGPKAKGSAQARKRAQALRACHKKRGRRRAVCDRRARARYAVKGSRETNATKKGRG